MAWNQKISAGFILTILLFFFISCKNQYIQQVALYESPLDSVYLTKQSFEKDTIQLNFNELKLSKSSLHLTDVEIEKIRTVNIDSLHKEYYLDTLINHESSVFHLPKPYIKSDSIVNSKSRYSVKDSINFQQKKIDLIVKENQSLRDSVSLALTYLKELKASLNTKVKLDRQEIKTELKPTQTNLGLAKKDYTKKPTLSISEPIKHYSNKDTVFIKEIKHYSNKDTVFIKEIKHDYNLKSNNPIRKIIYDTIKTTKTALNNNIIDDKSQRKISQKESQINRLKDSLTLLNRQLILANNTKSIDTIVVEKNKSYKEPITSKPIVNTYIAYYSINKLNPRNIGSILGKLKQIELSKIEKVYLSGYTDATGSLYYNNLITTKRLARIRKRIKTLGVSEYIIFSQNFAKRHTSKSILDSDRRVEIKILIKK